MSVWASGTRRCFFNPAILPPLTVPGDASKSAGCGRPLGLLNLGITVLLFREGVFSFAAVACPRFLMLVSRYPRKVPKKYRFLMTSVFSDKGRTTPCSFCSSV